MPKKANTVKIFGSTRKNKGTSTYSFITDENVDYIKISHPEVYDIMINSKLWEIYSTRARYPFFKTEIPGVFREFNKRGVRNSYMINNNVIATICCETQQVLELRLLGMQHVVIYKAA